MAYQGETVTIPLGKQGLLTDVAPGDIPPTALIVANNINLSNGSIEKSLGSRRYNDSSLGAGVVALFDWNPTTILQRMIVLTADGSIYRDIGDKTFSLNTPINTDFGTPGVDSQFVSGGNEVAGQAKKLYLFTKSKQLHVLEGDGTSFAEIGSPAADWTTPNFPTGGLIHSNRLWAYGNDNAQSTIYASNTGDHSNFASGILIFNVFPGEGGRLKGAVVYRGRLFVFKEGDFVYYLEDSDASSDNWYFKKLSSGFGLAAPNSISQVLDDLVVGNSTGSLTSMKATEQFGDIESGDVLALVKVENYMRTHTSLSGVRFMHSLYYPAKKQAYYTYRSKYGSGNDTLLTVDVNDGTRVIFGDKDQADCLALRRDIDNIDRPMYGAADGYVYLMDQEDRSVGGFSYTGEFQTPHMDFRFLDPKIAHRQKHFDFLSVEFVPQGGWDLSADVFIDGKFSETITFEMKVRDDGMDSFTLNTDKLGRQEAQNSPAKPLHGTGRRLSIRFYNSGLLENFKISSFTVGFRPAGDGPTRL